MVNSWATPLPSSNLLLCLIATVFCTPRMAASPRSVLCPGCCQHPCLQLCCSEATPDSQLCPIWSLFFLSPQGLHSNFWDQLSRMRRWAPIYHCPLLCPQGMRSLAPLNAWILGRVCDRHHGTAWNGIASCLAPAHTGEDVRDAGGQDRVGERSQAGRAGGRSQLQII